VTVDDVLACVGKWNAQPCAALNAQQFPDCFPGGSKQVGEPCLYARQCESAACSGRQFGSPACGRCLAVVRVGEPCGLAGAQCEGSSECKGGTCQPPIVTNRPPDAACDRYGECSWGYICIPPTSGGHCRPVPKLGESCKD